MRRLLIGVGLTISLGMRIQPLGAQSPVSVGVGVGIAMPSTTLRDEANPGWRALASLDVGMPDMPTSLRIDAAYDRFGFKSAPIGSAGPPTGARTIATVAMSLSLGSPDSLSKVSPYAVGGVDDESRRLRGKVGLRGRQADGVERGPRTAIRPARPARLRRRPHALRGAERADLCYVPFTVGLLFGAQGVNADD